MDIWKAVQTMEAWKEDKTFPPSTLEARVYSILLHVIHVVLGMEPRSRSCKLGTLSTIGAASLPLT